MRNESNRKLPLISLKRYANSRGAWELGLAKGITHGRPKGLFLLLGDDSVGDDLPERLQGIQFLAVQATYCSPVTEMANVVIPSPTWAEGEGTFVSLDGRRARASRVLAGPKGMLSDTGLLKRMCERMASILSESGGGTWQSSR
jgi:predicted molibdopterin-dependent oxidoreductase YjgC